MPTTEPFWWAPKRGPAPALIPVDFVECLCGTHVWISADGTKREYEEGRPHACPLDDPDYGRNYGGDVFRRVASEPMEVEPTSITVSTNGHPPNGDADDALRGL